MKQYRIMGLEKRKRSTYIQKISYGKISRWRVDYFEPDGRWWCKYCTTAIGARLKAAIYRWFGK